MDRPRQRSPVRGPSPQGTTTIPLSPPTNRGPRERSPPSRVSQPSGMVHSNPSSVAPPSTTASSAPVGGTVTSPVVSMMHHQQQQDLHALRAAQHHADNQQHDIQKLQAVRETQNLQNNSLSLQLDRQQKETGEVMSELFVARRQIQEAEALRVQSVVQAQNDKQRDQDTIFQLRHQLERQREEFDRARGEKEKLLMNNDATTEARKMDEAALNNLSLENESLKRAIRRKDENAKKSESVSAQRAKELATLSVAKVKLDQQIGSLGGQLNAARAQVEQLQMERDGQERHYHVELQHYKEAVQDLKDDLAVKEGRLVGSDRNSQVAQEQQHALKSQLYECEAENASLVSQVKELETKYAAAVSDRENKVSELRAETDARLKELNSMVTEQSQSHTTSRAANQSNVETLNKELLALQVENQKLHNQLLLSETTRIDAKSEADMSAQRCGLLEQNLEEKNVMLETQRLATKDKNEVLATEKALRAEFERKNTQLTIEVGHLRKSTEDMTQQITQLTTDKIRIESELQVSRDAHRAAENHYQEEHAALLVEQEKVVKLASEVQGLVASLSSEEKARWTRDAQLESQDRSLTTAKTLYEEKIRSLAGERDAYRDSKETEGRQLKERHAEELDTIRQSYETKIQSLERGAAAESQQLKAAHGQQALDRDRLISKYEMELNTLKEETAANLKQALFDQEAKLNSQHAEEKASLERTRVANLSAAEQRAAQQHKELEQQYQRRQLLDTDAAEKDTELRSSQVERLQGELAVAVEARDNMQRRYNESAEKTRIELEKYGDRVRAKEAEVCELRQQALDHKAEVESHKKRHKDEVESHLKRHEDEVNLHKKRHVEDVEIHKKRHQEEVHEHKTVKQQQAEALTKDMTQLKKEHQTVVDNYKTQLAKTQEEWDKQTLQHKKELAASNEKLAALQAEWDRQQLQLREELQQLREELQRVTEEHASMATKLALSLREQEEAGNQSIALRAKVTERDALIDTLYAKLAATANLEELLLREDKLKDKEFIFNSRGKLTQAIFELYSHSVATRKHLKSTFQMSSWRRAVEKNYIPDEVGDNLCQVVEDVQWMHDRGHFIIGQYFTEIEQAHLGTSPSFFRATTGAPHAGEGLPTAAAVVAQTSMPQHSSPMRSPRRDHSMQPGASNSTIVVRAKSPRNAAHDEVMSPRSASHKLWPGAQEREASPRYRF